MDQLQGSQQLQVTESINGYLLANSNFKHQMTNTMNMDSNTWAAAK